MKAPFQHILPLGLFLGFSLTANAIPSDLEAPWLAYPTSLYPNGLSPQDAALADVDGDGFVDVIAISNSANPALSILPGDGIGGLLPPTFVPLTTGGDSLAAGDIDGDGDADLIVAETGFGSPGTSFAVHLNQGSGTFAPSTSWPLGGFAQELVLADIDGNGTMDVVAAQSQSVALALGFGDGTFQPPALFVLTNGVVSVSAGDLDGDGDNDLAVGHSSGKISVLTNLGTGFSPATSYTGLPTGSFNGDASVLLADVDADADLDVLLSGSATGTGLGGPGGSIALFRNQGNGTLSTVEALLLGSNVGGASNLAHLEIDGDGTRDLVASASDGNWYVLSGDGSGGFSTPAAYRSARGTTALLAGDFDGDSDTDVALLAADSMEVCLHVNRNGAFARAGFFNMVSPNVAPASSSRLVSADIDLDGDLDVVTGYSENWNGAYGLSVARNQGDGSFAAPELYPTTDFPEWVTLGDLTGDGYPDLVWLDGWGSFTARVRGKRNLGDGSFGPTFVLPGAYCEQNAQIRIADMTADGLPDIVLYTCYDLVFVIRNSGDGSFLPPVQTRVSGGSGAFAIGDFNSDGFADIVTNSGVQGYVEVSLGIGDGSFLPPSTEVTGRGVQAIEVADMNADGLDDIVAAYALDGDGVSVLLARPGGTFAATADYPGTYSGATSNLVVSDLDQDGNLDVFVPSQGAQAASFWRGSATGTLSTERRFGVGTAPTSLAAGDYNGDGIHDLLALVEPDGLNGWYYPAITLIDGVNSPWANLGNSLAGPNGAPSMQLSGTAEPGSRFRLDVSGTTPHAALFHVIGMTRIDFPFAGGTLVPVPTFIVPASTDALGSNTMYFNWPMGTASGTSAYFQSWVVDPAPTTAVSATQAIRGTQP